jgi:hypothetical protein
MLYGMKEMIDNRVATLIVAGDTVEEHDQFWDKAQRGSPKNFVDSAITNLLQHMMDPMYSGLRKQVQVFKHADENQREAFFKQWDIKLFESKHNAIDKQDEILFEYENREHRAEFEKQRAEDYANLKATGEYNPTRGPTIAEVTGTDKHDPWDRRTTEEKQQDEYVRRMYDDANQSGNLIKEGSFGFDDLLPPSQNPFFQPPVNEMESLLNSSEPETTATPEPTENDGKLNVTGVHISYDPDGKIKIHNIKAEKKGGPINEELKQVREENEAKTKEAVSKFSPMDFAAILAGDMSKDEVIETIGGSNAPVGEIEMSEEAKSIQQQFKDAEEAAIQNALKGGKNSTNPNTTDVKFKGTDLFPDKPVTVSDLPTDVQEILLATGHSEPVIQIKEYPEASMLGGKILLPFDSFGSVDPNATKSTALVNSVNMKFDGTIGMGTLSVAVVSLDNKSNDGWVVYQKKIDSIIVTSLVKVQH